MKLQVLCGVSIKYTESTYGYVSNSWLIYLIFSFSLIKYKLFLKRSIFCYQKIQITIKNNGYKTKIITRLIKLFILFLSVYKIKINIK